jgi:stage V sporulation protein SpoVS
MVARGFLGCFVVDRAGRNESLDELAKRHGGTAKKASSAKKQRARKVHMVMTSSNSKIITTTRGDIICVAGPGAVDQAFLNKAVSRGRLVLSAVDRVMLQLSWADVEADSDDEKSNCHNSMAAHAVMRGEAAAHAAMRGAGV